MTPEELLVCWRETRSIRVARAYAAAAPSPGPALPTGRSKKSVAAWDAAFGAEDRALEPLLEAACTATSSIARDRMVRLSDPPDPRVLIAVLGWTESMPFRTEPGCRPFWNAVYRYLRAHGPPDFDWNALDGALLRAGSNFAMAHAARVTQLAEDLPAASRALSEAEDTWLSENGFAAAAEPGTSAEELEALLQAVYDDPDDIGRRAVYADALQSNGDPRGTFIALQLHQSKARKTSQYRGRSYDADWGRKEDDTSAEETALLATHANTWLGPWIPAISRITWHAGFPTHLEFASKAAKIGKLADQPAMSTVKSVSFRYHYVSSSRGGLRKTLRSPYLSRVESIGTLLVEDLRHIRVARAPHLRALKVLVRDDDELPGLFDELSHWTALQTLQLGLRRECTLIGPTPSDAVFEAIARHPVPHLELYANSDAAVATLLARLPAAVTTLTLHTQGGFIRIDRGKGTATYVIPEPEPYRTARIDLELWHAVHQCVPTTIEGSADVADLGGGIAALSAYDDPLDRVHLGRATAEMFEGLQPPRIAHLIVKHADDPAACLRAVEPVSNVHALSFQDDDFRIDRDDEGRFTHLHVDRYSWSERGAAPVRQLAEHLRTATWQRSPPPPQFTAFCEEISVDIVDH